MIRHEPIPMLDVRVVTTSATGEQVELLLGWVPKSNVEDALTLLRAPGRKPRRARDEREHFAFERARDRHVLAADVRRLAGRRA